MKSIDEFEKKTRKLARDITPEEFTKILQDKNFQKDLFSNKENFLEIISEIEKRTLNEDFRKALLVIRLDLEMQITEANILELFATYSAGDIERPEFLEKISEKINGDNPIVSFSYALCSLTSVEDLSIDYEKMAGAAGIILDYFGQMTPDYTVSYQVRIDLLDLLCHVRAKYFRIYQKDILTEDQARKLDEILKELHDFEDAVMLEKVKEIYPESNETPEEIGLIDITKLHKEEE